MLPISSIAVEIRGEPRSPVRADARRLGLGLLCSLLLHAAALLLAFGLFGEAPSPPKTVLLVPIDLVRLGERSAAPPRRQAAATLPQQQAPEVSPLKPADPVPQPQVPPPPPQGKAPESDPLAALALRARPELPNPPKALAFHPAASHKPSKRLPPVDDLAARLESLARLRQPQAQVSPSPRQHEDWGSSNVTASAMNAASGPQAIYGVKDFIRAQIERHWYFDKTTPGADMLSISIRLVLNGDGSIGRVSIVDNGRFNTDATFRSVAISLRNAAWMSSPLQFPAGRYDDVKDMVLEFNPKDVLQ